MCISPIFKFIVVLISSFIILFITVFEVINFTNYDPLLVLILTFIIVTLFCKCPKCQNRIGNHRYGFVNLKFSKYCQKCGQDLMKCEIETDEEIETRKKKQKN
jgi:hypothetical protein